MTWDDVRCENLSRDRAIESIRSALHKSASQNPHEIRDRIAAAHKKTRRLVSSAGRCQAIWVSSSVAR